MRVAYLINQYPKVSHSFIRREIRALEELGVEVTRLALRGFDSEVVDPRDDEELAKTHYVLRHGATGLLAPLLQTLLRWPGLWFKTLAVAIGLSRGSDRRLPYHLVYFAEACWIRCFLEGRGVQHLHAHFGSNSTEVAMLLAKLGGPGFSFTAHGPEEFDRPEALHLSEKIAAARFVVAVSSFGRSQLYRWIDYKSWPKVREIHCAVDTAFTQDDGAPVPDVSQFVCVGRLCEQKGQLLLLEAIALLRDRGIEVSLVLAGDGDFRNALEAFIGEKNLSEAVTITGWVSEHEVRDLLLASRALVLPSFAEGLPVVLMEAMALERPVISSYVAGIPELVVDGGTGWLIPAGSADAIAVALEECLATPVKALEAMGQAGHARVAARHNATEEARKLLQAFSESCG